MIQGEFNLYYNLTNSTVNQEILYANYLNSKKVKLESLVITNLDSTNSVNVNLQIDVTESGSGASAANETATILLAAGQSFVMGTPHDSIAVYDTDASVQTTLHDLESILIDPSANEVKLEIIAAST